MKRKWIRIGGRNLSISGWARELGVTRCAFYFRIRHFGETMEQAVSHFVAKADEKNLAPMPCPFCGGSCSACGVKLSYVVCDKECGYESRILEGGNRKAEAVSLHNEVCKAVAAYRKGATE